MEVTIIIQKLGRFDGHAKSAVNAHIARSTHHRRRRQKSQAIHHPAQSGSVTAYEHQGLSYNDGPHTKCVPCHVHRTVASKKCRHCQQYHVNSTVQHLSRRHLTAMHGNSDPFDSQIIKIDARVAQYMDIGFSALDVHTWGNGYRVTAMPRGFTKETVTIPDPTFYMFGTQLESISANKTEIWSATHAYAVLANAAGAAYATEGSAVHGNAALDYSALCIQGLRNCIIKGVENAIFHTDELVLRLLKAELVAQRFARADIHAKFLEHHLEEQAQRGTLNRGFLTRLLFSSNTLAIGLWKRPRFTSSWLEECFREDWALFYLDDPSIVSLKDTLARWVELIPLSSTLLAVQQLFIETGRFVDGETIVAPDRWYWLMARDHYIQHCLLNLTHNYQDRIRNISDDESRTMLLLACSLALAAILALRPLCSGFEFGGKPLYPQCFMLLVRLNAMYQRLNLCMLPKEAIKYSIPLLWIAYVGTLTEYRFRRTISMSGCSDVWKQRLTAMIVEQGINSQEMLQQSLKLLPFSKNEMALPAPGMLDKAFELVKRCK